MRGRPYPPGLKVGAVVLGLGLEQQVGWSGICTMKRYRTLEDWVRSLPADRVPAVCALLELD
jgi:hypothetical protein